MNDRDELVAILEGIGIAPESERGYGQIVVTDLVDALLPFIEKREAKVWGEGFTAGFDLGTNPPLSPRHDNPYRKQADQ